MNPDDQIVRPRKPSTNANRPIVVVIGDEYLTEDGEIGQVQPTLLSNLRGMPPSTIVYAGESAKLLRMVQDTYGQFANFNFRVAPIEREIFAPNNPRRLVQSLTSVAWFGWREKPGRNCSIRNRYHLLIDPLTFGGEHLKPRTFEAHLTWAKELREFCIAQGWDLKPTQGAVGRQALRDPRFYPKPRRKVPRATNDRVRDQLPGNHYQLADIPQPDKEHHAEYLDQTKCHHWHAKETPLPDADTLYGYGRFRRLAGVSRTDPDRIKSFLANFKGLVYGTLRRISGKAATERYKPHYLSKVQDGPVYFYTADLDLLASLGYEVCSLTAAWGGYDRDHGIARYATWAVHELGDKPPLWKKRLLLTPYGALATAARQHSVAYHQSKGGEQRILRSRSGIELPVKYHQAHRVAEPSTNNVLHRALIEASNRTETLMYANYLESIGHKVLCIYVDAVIVETDEDLPLPIYAPWRNDQTLTRLRFLSESQWIADQTERLPGITGAQRQRYVSRGTVGKAAHLGTAADQWDRVNRAWVRRLESPPGKI